MCCANRNQISDKYSSAKTTKQQQVAQERQEMANARAQMEAEAQWQRTQKRLENQAMNQEVNA